MNEATTTKKTVTESLELMTGFDEIAVEKKFGEDIDSLRVTMSLRALVFLDHTRAGEKPQDAYDAAMGLTTKQLNEHFADDPDEVNPEEPITDSGKDSTHAE